MPVLEQDMTMYEMRFENEKSVNPAQCSSSKRHIPPRPLLSLFNLRHNTLLTMTMPCRCVTCSEQFLPGRIAVLAASLCSVSIIFEMLPGLGLN